MIWQPGGLVVEMDLEAAPALRAPQRFDAPDYLDFRPYCLPADDQGSNPDCAARAACGLAEIRHWQRNNERQQFDAARVYIEAKRLDGNRQPGTSLQQAVRAAANLGFLRKIKTLRTLTRLDAVIYALHSQGPVLLAWETTDAWQKVGGDGWIPETDKSKSADAHATLGCWYNAEGIGFQNSWAGWGAGGFGRLRWAAAERRFLYGLVVEELT